MQHRIHSPHPYWHGLTVSYHSNCHDGTDAMRSVRDQYLGLKLVNNEMRYKGINCRLKATPFRLINLLAQNAESIVSRKTILKEVWGYDFDPGTKIIEVQINYLRKILRSMASDYEIKTHWRKGISLQRIQNG